MPDIALLKDISKDFNVDISDLLEGEYKKDSNKNKKKLILFSMFVIFIVLMSFYVYNINRQQFSFKTLSTSCKDFKIIGSIAYSNSKSSIYISSVDYCGKDNKEEYSYIECILYEVENNKENEINKYIYDKDKKITLEKFFRDVKFKVDNYDRICKKYNNHSLYLRVNATNDKEKITTYKINIKVNDDCF